MAAFLYFFPESKGIGAGWVPSSIELVPVFSGASFEVREVVGSGPSKTPGSVVVVRPESPVGKLPDFVGYRPECQQWEEVHRPDGTLSHWLGTETVPCPEDLMRQSRPEGHLVELGDGNKWIIPSVAACNAERVTLPQTMKMKDNGDLEMSVKSGYEELVSEAAWWYDVFVNGGKYTFERYWKYASMLLAVSYRIGRTEINRLGLLLAEQRQRESLIYASLGFPDLLAEIEAQKKTVIQQDG